MSKNNENKLVPNLRFPEFKNNGEWKENSLNEVSPAIFDGTHQTPTYTENGIPFFSVENIISGNKNKFISQEDYLLATSKNKPEKGDIIITRIGNIGTSKVIDWDYEFSVYVTLAIVKKSSLFDSHYLHGYLQSSRYQKEILSKSLLNAVPCKINMDELRKTKILLPPDKEKKEQLKIAACLTSLDEVITAERNKLEVLKEHKKGLLQNLFPQEGETLPKVRFKEFEKSGEWEEKSFEELFEIGNGRDYKHLESGNIPVYGSGGYMLSVNDFLYDGESVCIGRKGTIDKPIFLNGKFWTVDTLFYTHSFKSSLPKYIFYVFEGINWREHNEAGGVPSLSKTNICKIKVLVPPNNCIAEQEKIASCLSSIDELIIKQGQKVEAMQLHKKGLLQGLFPYLNEVRE